jgi:hypothetical protein
MSALSVWHYLVAVYGLDIQMAGGLAIAFSAPASLLRILGGVLSDCHVARRLMYWCFIGVSLHLHPFLSADRLYRAWGEQRSPVHHRYRASYLTVRPRTIDGAQQSRRIQAHTRL